MDSMQEETLLMRRLSINLSKSKSGDSEFSALDFLCDMCAGPEINNLAQSTSPLSSPAMANIFEKFNENSSGYTTYNSDDEVNQEIMNTCLDYNSEINSTDTSGTTTPCSFYNREVDSTDISGTTTPYSSVDEYDNFSNNLVTNSDEYMLNSQLRNLRLKVVHIDGKLLLQPISSDGELALSNIAEGGDVLENISVSIVTDSQNKFSSSTSSLMSLKSEASKSDQYSVTSSECYHERETNFGIVPTHSYHNFENLSRYTNEFSSSSSSLLSLSSQTSSKKSSRKSNLSQSQINGQNSFFSNPKHIYKTACDTYRVQVGKGSKNKPNGKFSRNARNEIDAIWLCELALLFIDCPPTLDEIIYNGNYKILFQRGLVISPEDFLTKLCVQAESMRARCFLKEEEWERAKKALLAILTAVKLPLPSFSCPLTQSLPDSNNKLNYNGLVIPNYQPEILSPSITWKQKQQKDQQYYLPGTSHHNSPTISEMSEELLSMNSDISVTALARKKRRRHYNFQEISTVNNPIDISSTNSGTNKQFIFPSELHFDTLYCV